MEHVCRLCGGLLTVVPMSFSFRSNLILLFKGPPESASRVPRTLLTAEDSVTVLAETTAVVQVLKTGAGTDWNADPG